MKVKEIWPVQSECSSIVSSSTPIDKAEHTKIYDLYRRKLESSVRIMFSPNNVSIVSSSTPIDKAECTKIYDLY